jgi:penicillin-binding protein 1A
MVSAFAAFANRGVLMRPLAILRVEDKFGNVLEEYHPVPQEVLSEGSAYIITDMMRGVLDMGRGTGRLARTVYGFTRPAAGKTGTTNEFSDAWFVGFTPQIAAGVWVGVDDPSVTLGTGQSGAVAALPIWAPFMRAAHDTLQLPVEDFVMPESVVRVEICNETKLLATETCPEVVSEVFPRQQAPTSYCTKHGGTPPAYRGCRGSIRQAEGSLLISTFPGEGTRLTNQRAAGLSPLVCARSFWPPRRTPERFLR